MMDQITIKDLEVYANHGLYKEDGTERISE